MQSFLEKQAKHMVAVLSGGDRIVFRGTLRLVANLAGMNPYLSYLGILMKDFKQYALDQAAQLIQASRAKAEQAGRPPVYRHSSRTNKEQVALDIAVRDGVKERLICILRTVEPCLTYTLHKNRQARTLDLELFQGKCMHLYHYWYDAYFGFMGARIQTWFPLAIQMWMNGREGLARRMDREHLAYRRCDNCFPWISAFVRGQALMDQRHQTDRCQPFDRIARLLNPAHETMFAGVPLHYYWTTGPAMRRNGRPISPLTIRRPWRVSTPTGAWLHHRLWQQGCAAVPRKASVSQQPRGGDQQLPGSSRGDSGQAPDPRPFRQGIR